MPIYEYECTKCGNIKEALQKFSDKPLTKCKHCSGKLNKLVSQSTFHLKGTGWYVTDYADKSKNSDSKNSDKSSQKKTEESKSVKTKSVDTDSGNKKQSTDKSTKST
jgi:putative FmdB family regulatory protein